MLRLRASMQGAHSADFAPRQGSTRDLLAARAKRWRRGYVACGERESWAYIRHVRANAYAGVDNFGCIGDMERHVLTHKKVERIEQHAQQPSL